MATKLLGRKRIAWALEKRRQQDAAELAISGEPREHCLYSAPILGLLHFCDLTPGHRGPWHVHHFWAGFQATLVWGTGVR